MGIDKYPRIPVELLDRKALFRFEPRLRHYYLKVSRRRGVEHIVRRRLMNHSRQLTPPQRAIRIRHHVARLMKLDVDERLRTLFIKEETRPYGSVLILVDEDRNDLRDLFTMKRYVPTIVLNSILGQTELPVSLSLRALQKQVHDFVKRERTWAGIEVARGRKPGRHGPEIAPFSAVLLAYLAADRQVRRRDLLLLADRELTPDGYHWLERRLTKGRHYLELLPDLKSRFDKTSTDILKEITEFQLF
jgi:hypothetical protein